MANARVSRGRKTEDLAAGWYREHGWEFAESIAASLPGKDIKGMPGFAPEIKARANFDPLAWTRQAAKNAKPGEIPFVVMRCNGQGEAQIGEWLVIRQLGHDTKLLAFAKDWQANGWLDPQGRSSDL